MRSNFDIQVDVKFSFAETYSTLGIFPKSGRLRTALFTDGAALLADGERNAGKLEPEVISLAPLNLTAVYLRA